MLNAFLIFSSLRKGSRKELRTPISTKPVWDYIEHAKNALFPARLHHLQHPIHDAFLPEIAPVIAKIMLRSDAPSLARGDSNGFKRRAKISHKRTQFAEPTYKAQEYPHRLNFYDVPPVAEITLEQFEQWAIDRLRSKYEI